MPFSKSGHTICSLTDWEHLAGPKSANQWVDGRSAKELARAWLESGSHHYPDEVATLIESHHSFGPAISWEAEPEARLRFDAFAGEPRNSDLVIYATDAFGPYLLAVEGKADEPYGDTIAKTLKKAEERLALNPRSNGVQRIHQLLDSLFGKSLCEFPELGLLRYQLLTACAGALAEAERKGMGRTIMLVHEFITTKTQDQFHARNHDDFSAFLRLLSGQENLQVVPDALYGPYSVAGGALFYNQTGLYIGKVSRNIRP